MKNLQTKNRLVNLPTNIQVSLSLIQEELKSRKLFHVLRKAGLYDSSFQPHLDSLIMSSIGLQTSNKTLQMYEEILERSSKKIEAGNDSIAKQAMKAYRELRNEKKKIRT